MIRLFIALLIISGSSFADETRGSVVQTLGHGEKFIYRVGWGVFPSVGEIIIVATKDVEHGEPRLHVNVETMTRGLVRQLYSYKNHAESIIDGNSGHLLSITEAGTDGQRTTNTAIRFDYVKREATYNDYSEPKYNSVVAIPEGLPLDLMTALIQTRGWNLQVGQSARTLVSFNDDFYDLSITADHLEKIHTPAGNFDTLVLVPRMVGEPRGMFKRGGQIRVWISQDPQHLPVKFELHLSFGSVIASLTSYQPPTAEHADSHP